MDTGATWPTTRTTAACGSGAKGEEVNRFWTADEDERRATSGFMKLGMTVIASRFHLSRGRKQVLTRNGLDGTKRLPGSPARSNHFLPSGVRANRTGSLMELGANQFRPP
jgi:hypothetical protein